MAGLDFSRIIEQIKAAESVALCGHLNPDGDCLGSVLALTHALRVLGKSATPLLATSAKPPVFEYLEGYDDFVSATEYEGAPDLFIMLDVPSPERMADGAAVMNRCAAKVKVDHHAGPEDIVDAAVIDTSAAAVGVMVWELIAALGVEPTKAMAQACYVALMTDTGSFKFQNADARAFLAASQMVQAGADPAQAATAVYQSKTCAAVKLESLVADRIRVVCDGHMAISWISQNDLDELGATKDDCEEITDIVRQLGGPEVSVVLRAMGGIIRGSIRSKTDFDVSVIAKQMNGGGHKAASGFTLQDGPIQEALQTVVDKVAAALGVAADDMAAL